MKHYVLFVVMLSAIVTISSLYITQPIQPLFIEAFDISIAQVTLFTSVPLFALALAPIFYGYLLEKFDTRIILCASLTLIGILQGLLCFCESYGMFLILRILEALAIPSALTATLTTLMRLDMQNTQKYISIYVASTVFGGVLSRVVGGVLTSIFSWQTTFAILGVTTLLVALMSYRLPNHSNITHSKITPLVIVEYLKDKRYALLYAGAFLVLFCFQGTLNFMPFEMKSLDPEITPAQIGFLYLGYIIGIIAALLSMRIVKFVGGQIRAIILGFVIFGSAPLFMLIPSFWVLFGAVFIICIGMFIAHSVLSGLTNSISAEKKGITNGLYLAFYYTGGTCGTTLPSFLYHHFGWTALCVFISAILFASAGVFYLLRRIFQGE